MQTNLSEEPTARPRSLAELMSLAAAMEREALSRYALLAQEMDRQGDAALAATFRALIEEERDHMAQVADWAMRATGAPLTAPCWELPQDIARSWDEVAGSALLTPYRALALAVLNEERGFAFYAYLAAHATDEQVRMAAEQLAAEELTHAATLRRARRRAFRREHPTSAPTFAEELDHDAFLRQVRRAEATAAIVHARLAERLAELGDTASASMLENVAAAESNASDGARPGPVAVDAAAASAPALLRQALAASEQLHDTYLDALESVSDDQVQTAAEQRLERVARELALIAARLHAPAP